jgi:branched-chain amino acid transport system substrate-binding protein
MRNQAKLATGIVALCLLATGPLSGCAAGSSGAEGDGDTYEVALLTDLTGPFGVPGATVKAGIEAYTKMVNADGGINGRQIELSVTDSLSTPDGARAGLQKIIAERPIIILNNGNASFSAVAPLLAQTPDVGFITAAAPDSALYPEPTRNVFMVQASATQQATALLTEMKARVESLDGKSFGLLGVDTPYSAGLIEVLKEGIEAEGGTLESPELYSVGSLSFTSQTAKIAGSGPAGVFHLGTSADSQTGLDALVTAVDPDVPIVTYSLGSSDETLEAVGASNVFGLRTTVNPAAGNAIYEAAEEQGFADKAVGNNFSLGWTEAATAFEALKECGEGCTSDQLIDQLESLSSYDVPSEALFGPVVLSASKHALLSSAQFYTWDGSKVVTEGPPIELGE